MKRLIPATVLAFSLASLSFLAGCSKSSIPQTGSTASGEILPGTVSDAMLDTDRSQAQAPLAPAAHSIANKADPNDPGPASEAATDPAVTPEAESADQPSPRPKASAAPKPPTP